MIEGVNGNRKLFRKEVNNEKRGKVESYSRIKDGMGGWHKERMKCEETCGSPKCEKSLRPKSR